MIYKLDDEDNECNVDPVPLFFIHNTIPSTVKSYEYDRLISAFPIISYMTEIIEDSFAVDLRYSYFRIWMPQWTETLSLNADYISIGSLMIMNDPPITGCEEPYFHWNYGRSTLKGLPILIAYFPQKYVGEYFVYTTSLF